MLWTLLKCQDISFFPSFIPRRARGPLSTLGSCGHHLLPAALMANLHGTISVAGDDARGQVIALAVGEIQPVARDA